LSVWLALLAACAGLVALDRAQAPDAELVEASVPSGRAASDGNETKARPEGGAGGPMILAIRPRNPSERFQDTFASHDWTPPPPPPPKPEPPPPPTAPPLPFNVLGKKLEDGAWQVFLARENQIFPVKRQDTIDNIYRIEEIRPPLMTLTYLPLNQRQTLSIGPGE
jgi:hypothetical protein